MNFFSHRARSITPYTAGEQPAGGFVKLNTNENPYPPSPRVAEAIRSFDANRLRLYPQPNADALRDAIAAKEGVGRENIYCGNGSDEVLAFSFAAFFDGDRAACFPDVTYSFYEVFAAFFGAKTAIVPLKEDFSVDLDGMRNAACGGYFLANPNAPTGMALSAAEVEAFVASVPDRLVVLDEAYADFSGESCVPLTRTYDNLLVVKTFSKSYSLAGIRCGYAVGAPALIGGLFRMKDSFNSYPVDALCSAACIAAIEDGRYHTETVRRVTEERERLKGALSALGLTVLPSAANFLFAGRASVPAGTLYARLKEEGVLVRHWEKPRIADFCRITVGTPEQDDILLEKLKKILS